MHRHSNSEQLSADSIRQPRRGNAIVLTLLVLIMLVGAGAYFFGPDLLSRIDPGRDSVDSKAMTHSVRRENLVVTVTDDGELQSASNVDVKCEIAGGSTILWIIDDGTVVEAEQKIVELDSSGIEEQLAAQTGIYEKALAAQIKAKEDAGAATIAVTEYVEGTYIKDIQEVDSLITIAQENMRSAQNVLEHTQRMARKGFATPLQVEADEFAVKRSQLDLDFARTSKFVLEKFTKDKTTLGLKATRDSAEALARSELATVTLEKNKLEKLTKQLEKCVILAPKAGMVVYYAERSRYGSSNSQIEEGSPVRERQTIIQLPDLTQMLAKVPVHESKVEQVHAGQRVYLKVLDREFQGVVTSIANQPESKSFFSAKVKEYPAEVRIEGDCKGLRPGMTAEVEILIANLDNVLTVPVSAVVVKGDQFFGYVKTPDGPQKRELLLGLSNDRFVEVKDGVSEGEDILMNPRAVMSDELNDDEDLEENDESTSVRNRFGESDGSSVPQSSPGAGTKPAGVASGSGSGKDGAGSSRSGGRSFSDFDKNGDGKITSDESPSPKMLAAIDKDGDGAISPAEFKNRPARPSPGGNPGTGDRPASGAR
jgi:HlyD family secretion protein